MKLWFEIKKLKNNEQGIALISVIMVLVVVSVLGVSLMGLAASNMKMSTGERSNQSTYYIAESGATLMMNEVNKQVLAAYTLTSTKDAFYVKAKENLLANHFFNERDISTINPNITFEETYGDQPSAMVSVEIVDENLGEYKIVSKGTINNSTRVVEKEFKLRWVSKTTVVLPDAAIFVDGKITVDSNSATINGSIGTNSIEEDFIDVHPNFYLDETKYKFFVGPGAPNGGKDVINKDFQNIEVLDERIPLQLKTFNPTPNLPFPETIIYNNQGTAVTKNVRSNNGNLDITVENSKIAAVDWTNGTNGLTKVPDQDVYQMVLNNLNFNIGSSNSRFEINIGTKNVELFVNGDFSVTNQLDVMGTGTLSIYVNGKIDLQNSLVNKVNIIKENGVEKITKRAGLAQINIYLRKSTTTVPKDVSITSTNTILNANIYAEDADFTFNGGYFIGRLITEGDLIMSGNNNIGGQVIGNTFSMTGNSLINFVPDVNLAPIPIEKNPLDTKFITEKPAREK